MVSTSAREQARASISANRSASSADAVAAVVDLVERLGGTHALCHPGTSWKALIGPIEQAPLL
jgi:hypothetical protein